METVPQLTAPTLSEAEGSFLRSAGIVACLAEGNNQSTSYGERGHSYPSLGNVSSYMLATPYHYQNTQGEYY